MVSYHNDITHFSSLSRAPGAVWTEAITARMKDEF